MKNPCHCYCITLRRAAGAISGIYDAHLEPAGLTINQFYLLRNIQEMRLCSVRRLAHRVGLEHTTIVRTLKPLMARGLVCDKAEAGRRDRQLALTGAGEALIAESMPLWQAAQAEIEARVGSGRVEELLGLLEHLDAPAGA